MGGEPYPGRQFLDPWVLAGLLGAMILALAGCAAGQGSEVANSGPTSGPEQSAGASAEATVTVTPPPVTVTARPSSQQPVKGMNTSSTLLSEESLREFQSRYGDSASISVAGMDGTSSPTVGDSRAPYAWSTAKILIVAQTLLDSGGPNNLTEEQRSLISSALASSDNEAAATLHRQIEAGHGGLEGAAEAMNQLLRKAGDESTSVSTQGRSTYSTYGQTLWSSQAQASFMSALMRGCVLDGQSTTFLREQMGNVVPDQRWGLGEVQSPAFKGGWGPDPDGKYLVRQVGVVPAGDGHLYAVAFTARPEDGSFESGQRLATDIAHWLQQHVSSAPGAQGC